MIVRPSSQSLLRWPLAAIAPIFACALLGEAPAHAQHLAPLLLFSAVMITLALYGAGPSFLALAETLAILRLLHPEHDGVWRASDIFCAVLTVLAACVAQYLISHRLLEARRQRDTLLKSLSSTSAPLILRDSFGAIILWSSGAEALYGWSAAEAEGRFFNKLLRAELSDGVSMMQRETLSKGEWQGSLIHHTRDGRRLHVYSRWMIVVHEGEQLILQYDTDVSRESEMARSLAKLREEHADATLSNQSLRTQLELAREQLSHLEAAPAPAVEPDAILPIEITGPPAPLQEHERRFDGEALVVDDEVALRKSICRFLEREGMLVHEAGNYEEAMGLIAIHGSHISLLLTDLVLPGKNGRLIAEEAERRIPGLRVIFASGYAADVLSHYGVFESGRPLLQKPFTRERLIKAVQRALDQTPTSAPPPDFTSGSIPANL